MLLAICLILIVWSVEVPLWLSIVVTVFSGVTILYKLISNFISLGVKIIDKNFEE